MQDAIVITGTLLLDSVPIVVLFDYGSTHALIAQTLIPRIRVGLENLGNDLVAIALDDLVVITLAGTILTTQECVRGLWP